MDPVRIRYDSPPSAWRYMAQGFRSRPGWDSGRGFPDLHLTWAGYRIVPDQVGEIRRLAALEADDGRLALLVPHVTGFRLSMAALTHPAWPLPIWRALQVRNRLRLHRPLRGDERFDLTLGVGGWRVAAKGIEVDLCTRLLQGDDCAWDSVITFYYRGRHGSAISHGPAQGAPPDAPALDEAGPATALGPMPGTGRWRFGTLTGDYNPVHQWDGPARRLGFAAAFAHSQRGAARCLASLPVPAAGPQQLDLWIKGPLVYGRETALRHVSRATGGGRDFGLWLAGEPRPALVGSWFGLGAGRPV